MNPPLTSEQREYFRGLLPPKVYREVMRIRDHPEKVVNEHAWVGDVDTPNKTYPGWLHYVHLLRNVLFLGPPGSQKSSLINLILIQLLLSLRFLIIRIDCKDGPADRNLVVQVAEKLGLPIDYFTIETMMASQILNLLDQDFRRRITIRELNALLMGGYGLVRPGMDDNAKFYARKSSQRHRAVWRHFPHMRSFEELESTLQAPNNRHICGMEKKEFDTTTGLLGAISELVDLPQLNGHAGNVSEAAYRNRIDLEKRLLRPGLIIISLPSGSGTELSQIFLSLLIRAIYRQVRLMRGANVQTVVVLDDVSEALGPGLEPALKQCRSYRVSFWFAVQVLNDLEVVGYKDVVMNATGCKVYFAAPDLETQQTVIETSGLRIRTLHGTSTTKSESDDGTTTVTSGQQTTQQIEPRHDAEWVRILAAIQGLAVIDATPIEGWWRWMHPVFVQVPFPTSREESDRLADIPWPEMDERFVRAEPPKPRPSPTPPSPTAPTPTQTPRKIQLQPRRAQPKAERKPNAVPKTPPVDDAIAQKLRELGEQDPY